MNVDQDEETYRKCLDQEVVCEGENGYVDWRWLREGQAKDEYILGALQSNSRILQQSLH